MADYPSSDEQTSEVGEAVQPVVDPITQAPTYTDEQRKQLAAEVKSEYDRLRSVRRPHELQWFINAAYRKGKHTTEAFQGSLTPRDLANVSRKRKNIANKLWAKGRARHAKFVKGRPKAVVVPFTHERKDRLNARATERALDYTYERIDQEEKYSDALLWAADTFKAYWFIHWNPDKLVPIKIEDPILGMTVEDVPDGDIDVEVESGFGIVVPDLRKSRLKDQPYIIRVRTFEVAEMKKRYPEFQHIIKADTQLNSPFEFERQIAHLSGNDAGSMASHANEMKGPSTAVLVLEKYIKPCAEYAQGRTIVVMNDFAVDIKESLPHGFHDMENPYPVVEFSDMPQVGQFYGTTFIEQLIPLQRGYNMLRDKLEAQIRLNVHPKWMVPKQARVTANSLTNEAGEVVEYNYIPGMPEPHPVTPGNIVSDAWRFLQMLEKEFDDISQIYPSSEGEAGSSKSGFQTNLLQEASDSVHSPDARGFELAIRDASLKFRRLMKQYYTMPRLISFAGRSSIPEVFEFKSDQIDEHALIRVQIGSGLSTFKATRIQQLVEMWEKGLLGDPADPEVKRRVMSILDIGGIEEFQERAALDEDMARMENLDILAGEAIPNPMFYENHLVHYTVHTDELKSPANKNMPEPMRMNLIMHVLLHMKYINPVEATNLAIELGMVGLIESGLLPPPMPPPLQGGQAPGAPPPPQGGGQPVEGAPPAPAPTL